MDNPSGPYPGRQVFLGITESGSPAFAYLVTGRSPASRERRATPTESGIIMGPLGDTPYDPLRHYTAVRCDNTIGLLVVTNGIQTEAIFETYKLLYHCGTRLTTGYLKKLMDGANYEPDSLQTPRIAGVIVNPPGKDEPVYLIAIKTAVGPATAWKIQPAPGTLVSVSTYSGDMENPAAFNVAEGMPVVSISVNTPEKLAAYIYEISAASRNGEDIRVCAVAGVRSGAAWATAVVNRHRG